MMLIIEFVDFLLKKVFQPIPIRDEYVIYAFNKAKADIKYHCEISDEDLEKRIVSNSNDLVVFLFRLGEVLHINNEDLLKQQIHWLLKELCSCEIYFNNEIEEGFYVVHGQGTVIGSRNKIGKGFIIHQGCTIGHKKNGAGAGNVIGDNVTLYANSSIIGELNIGKNVIIGAHVLITKDIPDNTVVTIKNNKY